MDHDGRRDVVTGDGGGNSGLVVLHRNLGGGSWSASTVRTSSGGDVTAVIVVDVDQDLDGDVISAGKDNQVVKTMNNGGSWSSTTMWSSGFTINTLAPI